MIPMPDRPADIDPTRTGLPAVAPEGGSAPVGFDERLTQFAQSQPSSTENPAADPTVSNLPVIPGYRLHREIGEGGMGVVYEATDERLRLRVALKVMQVRRVDRLAGNEGARQRIIEATRKRFLAESAILARLEHPNVVRVYAAGEVEGWPYYSMRFLPRGSLQKHFAAARRDAATVARLMAKVARAVQYLHDRGVWHRDLKPPNVLLTDDGEPQVADFGVAKWVDGEDPSTQAGVLLGTYSYMAPEMFQNGSRGSGPAADVWAMGVMLYELLAGRRPFAGDHAELMFQVLSAPPPPLAGPGLTPGTDERLEAVALRALAKDPALRYPSATALADDLDGWLGGPSDAAVPLDALRRNAAPQSAVIDTAPTVTAEPAPAKPRRRWRGVGWLATGVAILATVAVAVAAWPEEPPPEPKLALTQLLERDGEVLVIDKDGNALLPLTEIAGSQGGLKAAQNGYFAVTGAPVTMVEISSETIPFPFALEADVRHEFGIPNSSRVGLYAGRGGHRLPAVAGKPPPHPEQVFYSVTMDTCATLEMPTPPGSAVASGVRYDPNDPNEPDLLTVGDTRPNTPPARLRQLKDGEQRAFLRLVLGVYPNRFQPELGTEPFAGVTTTGLLARFGGAFFGQGRVAPTPLLGGGYGVIAIAGTAAVRNLRVRKLAP